MNHPEPVSQHDTDSPPVTAEFSYHSNEYTQFVFWSVFRLWWVYLAAFLCLALLEWLGGFLESDPDWLHIPWMTIGLAAVIAGALTLHCLFVGRVTWKSTASAHGPQLAVITPTALRWQSKGVTSSQDLSTLHSATETSSHFILWPSALMAHLIPKRALKSADDVARLRTYLRNGLPGTGSIKLRG